MYVNMVTRLVYKKKEVSTPPNKMKHKGYKKLESFTRET